MGIDGSSIRITPPEPKPLPERIGLLQPCPTCNKTISLNAESCPHCGEPLKRRAIRSKRSESSQTAALIGTIGTISLTIGSFCPIVSVPIIGNMNLFKNGDGNGVVLLVLAALSLVFLIIDRVKWLFYTGLGSAVVLVYVYYSFRKEMDNAAASLEREMVGNPFKGIADAAFDAVQLQWGWGVLIVGIALLVAASFISEN